MNTLSNTLVQDIQQAVHSNTSAKYLEEVAANALIDINPDNTAIKAIGDTIADLPQQAIPLEHFIHAGCYTRYIVLPANSLAVGEELAVDTVHIFNGDITVRTDEGIKRYTGFTLLQASKHKRRIGVIHETTHWVSVYATQQKDTDAAYKEMVI